MKIIDVNGHLNIQQMNKLVLISRNEILKYNRIHLTNIRFNIKNLFYTDFKIFIRHVTRCIQRRN
jgi:hypothetical protein